MKRKFLRVFLALLVLLGLPLLGWRVYLAHIINEELTQIHSAGLPTNGEELNRWYPAVPDNRNAALVLTQAFALLKTINTISDKHAAEALKLKDRFPRRADLLTSERIDLIRWYVETNRPAMMKTAEALKLPNCRFPIDCTRLMSTELPHLAHLANLAHLNQCAAALAHLDGHDEAATENIIAILALARMLDYEPCLISQLVRLRILRMAVETLELRANSGSFKPAEINTICEAFAHTHTIGIAPRALIGERAMTIPYFRMTRAEAATISRPKNGNDNKKDSPLPCHGPAILRLIGYYELDYGSYLLRMSHGIERLHRLAPENLRADSYFAGAGEASMERSRVISGIFLSAYTGVARRENEGVAERRLALTALAVESFRNENGRLPEELDELTREHFEEVPEDPFSGLDLFYRRKGNGYVIYSVGPDRKDDGGLQKADKKQSEDRKSCDITFTVER